jgi:uncharacterized protein
VTKLIYLHGLNSSPQSYKARLLGEYLSQHGLGDCYACPALSHWPDEALAAIEEQLPRQAGTEVCFVGSSLGGFYAAYVAEKHHAKAVLLNPAIDPHTSLRAYLGTQQNLHSGERYELSQRHFSQWAKLAVPKVTPGRYLLVVETGDEVLDYRRAVDKYAGARQIVVEGGDHSLLSFPEHMPAILEFAGIRIA